MCWCVLVYMLLSECISMRVCVCSCMCDMFLCVLCLSVCHLAIFRSTKHRSFYIDIGKYTLKPDKGAKYKLELICI